MPEEPHVTPDPLAGRLGRFTPHAGALDRDALLFAAGRASARPNRIWPALVGLLGITQAVTLFLLLTRSTPDVASPTGTPPLAVPFAEPTDSERPVPSLVMRARFPAKGLDAIPPSPWVEDLMPEGRMLNVLGLGMTEPVD
jgi:hypothetical protein